MACRRSSSSTTASKTSPCPVVSPAERRPVPPVVAVPPGRRAAPPALTRAPWRAGRRSCAEKPAIPPPATRTSTGSSSGRLRLKWYVPVPLPTPISSAPLPGGAHRRVCQTRVCQAPIGVRVHLELQSGPLCPKAIASPWSPAPRGESAGDRPGAGPGRGLRPGHQLRLQRGRGGGDRRGPAGSAPAPPGRTCGRSRCRGTSPVLPDREGLIDFVRRRFGRLDLLVNNAGVAPTVRADILEAGEESFDRLLAINPQGPLLPDPARRPLHDRAPGLGCTAGDAQRGHREQHLRLHRQRQPGRLLHRQGRPGDAHPALGARLAEHNIGVFEIQPGIIETDMTAPVKGRYDALFAQGLTPFPRGAPRPMWARPWWRWPPGPSPTARGW